MPNQYKRPTKIFELPSGKKVEIITYFSKSEIEEFRMKMLGDKKINGEKILQMKEGGTGEEIFAGMEFDFSALTEANNFARETAIKKLIDIDGTEYEASIEAIKDFIEEADGTALDLEINQLNKKKLTESN